MEPATDKEAYTPDIVDLQTWICQSDDKNAKQVWQATKYLSNPYDIWLKAWVIAGKPSFEQPEWD